MHESPPESFYQELKPRLHRRIAKTLRGVKSVVDLGCGNCELALFLAKSNRQQVIGVDISDASFPLEGKAAGSEGSTVLCVKNDASALTFLDTNSMDAVVSVWALHEMSSPLSVLREARRVLRPGGQILIVDFPRDSLAQELWNEDYYAPQEVGHMLREAGFAEVRFRLISGGQVTWAVGRAGASPPSQVNTSEKSERAGHN